LISHHNLSNFLKNKGTVLKGIFYSLSFIIACFLYQSVSASELNWRKGDEDKLKDERLKNSMCKQTFKDIGKGLIANNVNLISIYFNEDVYLNIIGSDKGYYSSSQAELIITDFFNFFQIYSFKYKRSHRKNNFAYATGVYKYNKGSGTVELGVTISLKYINNKWYIYQLNIN
jgi:hypothetical protein